MLPGDMRAAPKQVRTTDMLCAKPRQQPGSLRVEAWSRLNRPKGVAAWT